MSTAVREYCRSCKQVRLPTNLKFENRLSERRHKYEEANLHHTVFIDECGYNIWTARSREDRAYRQVCDDLELSQPANSHR